MARRSPTTDLQPALRRWPSSRILTPPARTMNSREPGPARFKLDWRGSASPGGWRSINRWRHHQTGRRHWSLRQPSSVSMTAAGFVSTTRGSVSGRPAPTRAVFRPAPGTASKLLPVRAATVHGSCGRPRCRQCGASKFSPAPSADLTRREFRPINAGTAVTVSFVSRPRRSGVRNSASSGLTETIMVRTIRRDRARASGSSA